jgi:hypothetical protein
MYIYNNSEEEKSYNKNLDNWGLGVAALNKVGEAWVNHFSDSKL